MPRVAWPHLRNRPRMQVILTLTGGQPLTRELLADTGAGSTAARFELILDEDDCLHCGGIPSHAVRLGGAYAGPHPVYLLRVRIPALAFDHRVRAVGVSTPPAGFDGLACFRFLNRFTYGNFGNPGEFGLES